MSDFFQDQGFTIIAALVIFILTLVVGAMLRPTFEAVGQKLLSWLRGLTSDFDKRYQRYLLDEYRIMNVRGRKTKSPVSLELERVYVSLRAQVPDIDLAAARRRSKKLTIGQAMQRSRRLVIIGGPGSGKTTLLVYLLLTYARRRVQARLELAESLFPIFTPLRQLKTVLEEKHSLPDYLTDYYSQLGLEPPADFFEKRLKDGRCLVLLDGLDEVADQAERVRLAKWVDAQVAIYSDNRFLVTSRPAGYDTAALENGFFQMDVQNFNQADIEQFCRNWCLAVETAGQGEDNEIVRRRAAAAAADLIGAIGKNQAVRALAINPLLLSIIALVHRYRATLPRRRVDLYAECVDVLLGKWDEAKGLAGRLTESQKRAVLQPLALYMHQHNTRELNIQTLKGQLEIYLPAVGGQPEEAGQFLREVRERSGLLLEQGLNSYTFSHQTFQEYLVARELTDNGPEKILLDHAGDEWWQEVTLLYTGLKDASPVVQALLEVKDTERHAPLLLAGRCLLDAQKIDPPLKAETLKRLEWLFDHGSGQPFLEVGHVLAELEDEQALARFLGMAGDDNEVRRNAALWALEQMLNSENEAQQQQYRHQLIRAASSADSADIKAVALVLLELSQQDKTLWQIEVTEWWQHKPPEAVKQAIARFLQMAGGNNKAGRNVALWALEQMLNSENEAQRRQCREQLMEAVFLPDSEYNIELAMKGLVELAQQDKWLRDQLMQTAFSPDSEYIEPIRKILVEFAQQDKWLRDQLMQTAFSPDSEYIEPAMKVLAELAQQDKSLSVEIEFRLPKIVAEKQTQVSQSIVTLLNDKTKVAIAADWLDSLVPKIPGMPVYIARYPVTNAQYRRFVEQGGYEEQKWWGQAGWQWRRSQAERDRPCYWEDTEWNSPAQPVVGVSWYEAEAYCNWLAEYTGRLYRLPDEAEWQRAAQGDDERKYPWGDEWQSGVCNSKEAGVGRTTPVGQYSPAGDSPIGCADMSGNVWEWCADWYDEDEDARVLRGGAWDFGRYDCSGRDGGYPGHWGHDGGFRVLAAPI